MQETTGAPGPALAARDEGADPDVLSRPLPSARDVRFESLPGTLVLCLRVRDVLGADAICLHLLARSGDLELVAAAGLAEDDVERLGRLDPALAGPVGAALASSRDFPAHPWEILGAATSGRALVEGRAACLPIGADDRRRGVATVFWVNGAHPPGDLRAAHHLLEIFAAGVLAGTRQSIGPAPPVAPNAPYRALFETALDAIAVVDDEGCLVDVNAAALQLTGNAREELIGRRFLEVVHPKDAPRIDRLWRTLRRKGSYAGATRVMRADGSLREVEYTACASFFPGLNMAIIRDVTGRRRAEEALRRSERGLARAQKMARLGHWEWDGRTRELRWSRQTTRILGVRAGTVKPSLLALLHAIPKRDRRRVLRAVRGTIEEGRRYDVVHRIIRADGIERIIHAMADVVLDADGRTVEMLGTVHDVTEQRKAEETRERLLHEIQAERSWLRAVIDHSPAGIVLIEGMRGDRLTANERAAALLGADLPPSGGAALAREHLLRADGSTFATEDLPTARALRGEVITAEELLVKATDGRQTPVLASCGPIHDQAGRLLGAVLMLEDITPLKELQRMREEWTSLIAHDLRQPLTVIDGHATLLVRQALRQAPFLVGRAEHILSSARNLRRMVSDLLEISRIEASRLELRCQATDLQCLVATVTDRLRPIAGETPLRMDKTGELAPVLADPVRVEQALANLISNALKYSFEGTEISIDLAQLDQEVLVSVTNQGEGIPAGELPHLFNRFHRTETAKKGHTRGIGLGLYITRGLIEAHGGRIWAESEPGSTTAFRFTLPLYRAGAESPEPAAT